MASEELRDTLTGSLTDPFPRIMRYYGGRPPMPGEDRTVSFLIQLDRVAGLDIFLEPSGAVRNVASGVALDPDHIDALEWKLPVYVLGPLRKFLSQLVLEAVQAVPPIDPTPFKGLDYRDQLMPMTLRAPSPVRQLLIAVHALADAVEAFRD